MYVDRKYREWMGNDDLSVFRVSVKDTDLHISVDKDSFGPHLPKMAERAVIALRYDLEAYIGRDPEFKTSLVPRLLLPGAPPIALTMAEAATVAGVGPMAAVAGAIAEYVGRELLKNCAEVIVENGGDIFMASRRRRLVAIFAGGSPFSNRLAVEIPPDRMPLGICTSSGTVGPSLSLGRADAAVILAGSAALADAAASAAGNVVQTPRDVKKGIGVARKIAGVMGAVIIKDDQLAVWGGFNLIPVRNGSRPPG